MTDLSRNQAIQNQRNSFLRGFPLPFNVETLQAFGALFQIPHYYRKFLHCKLKMLCNNAILFFDIEFFKYFFRILHEASSSWLKLFRAFQLQPVL
jgi:hypothetical protein